MVICDLQHRSRRSTYVLNRKRKMAYTLKIKSNYVLPIPLKYRIIEPFLIDERAKQGGGCLDDRCTIENSSRFK